MDGVLAIDVAGLQQILSATGPVEVAGQTIGADNVESYLLHDQYAGLTDSTVGDTDRQDELGCHRLGGPAPAPGRVDRPAHAGLGGVRGGRRAPPHGVVVRSGGPGGMGGQRGQRDHGSGLAGRHRGQPGGNKLDQYLAVSVGCRHPAVRRRAPTITADHHPRQPDPGRAVPVHRRTVPGAARSSYGEYTGIIADNLPGRRPGVTFTGAGPLSANGAEGPTWLIAAPFTLARGRPATVVVRFHLPTAHGSMTVVPSGRVPAEQWTGGGRTFSDDGPGGHQLVNVRGPGGPVVSPTIRR